MNMKLSKLTQQGLDEFTVFLDNINQIADVNQRREEILSTMSVEVDDIECMPIESSSRSKFKVTEYLATLLDSSSIPPETDKELWAWLSLYYFETIHKKNKKTNEYELGDINRWIPNFDDYKRYYRHLLLGPWNIYRQHNGDESIVAGILAGEIHTGGDVFEQLASRQELVTSSPVQTVVTELYYDKEKKSLKRGSGSKGPGTPRRLSAVLDQFKMTYDFYTIEPSYLINLLPKEFNRFKSN
jgi:hypothetical protein